MPNLNVKSGKLAATNLQFAPGVFTSPAGNKTVTVTHQAMVEALLAKGWTRTSD